MAEDQALTRVRVLPAHPRGPGTGSSSLLPGHSAGLPPALLGVGATRGCSMQGSRCIQMCSRSGVLCGMALLPAQAGFGRCPCPQLCQGENRLPNFSGAAVLRATDGHGNLPQFFLPAPALLHLRCLFGLLGATWAAESWPFWGGQTPKTPRAPWRSPRSWRGS